MNSVIQETDITVLCGFRGPEEQNRAHAEGKSRARFGQSKHNSVPSMAVDVAPYPIDWNDWKRWKDLSVVVKRHWHAIDEEKRAQFSLHWGGDWTSLVDGPHWELRRR